MTAPVCVGQNDHACSDRLAVQDNRASEHFSLRYIVGQLPVVHRQFAALGDNVLDRRDEAQDLVTLERGRFLHAAASEHHRLAVRCGHGAPGQFVGKEADRPRAQCVQARLAFRQEFAELFPAECRHNWQFVIGQGLLRLARRAVAVLRARLSLALFLCGFRFRCELGFQLVDLGAQLFDLLAAFPLLAQPGGEVGNLLLRRLDRISGFLQLALELLQGVLDLRHRAAAVIGRDDDGFPIARALDDDLGKGAVNAWVDFTDQGEACKFANPAAQLLAARLFGQCVDRFQQGRAELGRIIEHLAIGLGGELIAFRQLACGNVLLD